MRVTVLSFARLREIVGDGRVVRDAPAGATVETVWNALAAEFPGAAPFRPALAVAVNARFSAFSAPVADGDEVAFLPPVAGG